MAKTAAIVYHGRCKDIDAETEITYHVWDGDHRDLNNVDISYDHTELGDRLDALLMMHGCPVGHKTLEEFRQAIAEGAHLIQCLNSSPTIRVTPKVFVSSQ